MFFFQLVNGLLKQLVFLGHRIPLVFNVPNLLGPVLRRRKALVGQSLTRSYLLEVDSSAYLLKSRLDVGQLMLGLFSFTCLPLHFELVDLVLQHHHHLGHVIVMCLLVETRLRLFTGSYDISLHVLNPTLQLTFFFLVFKFLLFSTKQLAFGFKQLLFH